MRCYNVLVHGMLDWHVAGSEQDGHSQPRGFYCYRFILESDPERAGVIALERVRRNFDRRFDWLRNQHASMRLEVEEVSVAPLYKLLNLRGPGHAFYQRD